MSEPSGHEKGLVKIMVWGTALSFGLLAAAAVSMKDFAGGDAAFEFSFVTVVAFLLGALAGWSFWKFILARARKADKQK